MSATSQWDQHNLTDLIIEILRAVPADQQYGTGRAFMTTYQLVIEFTRRFPQVAAALGHSTGGEGEGPFALTNYFARWLPDRILNRGVTEIELRFLSSEHLVSLQFHGGVLATTNQPASYSTMFRLLDT